MRAIPEALDIRTFTPAHLDAALALSQEVRWPHTREDWEVIQTLSEGRVVLSGSRVIGCGFRTDFGPNLSSLNMIIVAEDRRGAGIGGAILASLIDAVSERSYRLFATVSGRHLYEKLGFVDAGTARQIQGIVSDIPVTEGASECDVVDRTTILQLESETFGGDRTALVDWLFRNAKLAALKTSGCVTGYAAIRRFGHGFVIGPVVAGSAADEMALVSFLARDLAGHFLRLDITSSSGLGPWLQTFGLKFVDQPAIMHRGKSVATEARKALFSQALG